MRKSSHFPFNKEGALFAAVRTLEATNGFAGFCCAFVSFVALKEMACGFNALAVGLDRFITTAFLIVPGIKATPGTKTGGRSNTAPCTLLTSSLVFIGLGPGLQRQATTGSVELVWHVCNYHGGWCPGAPEPTFTINNPVPGIARNEIPNRPATAKADLTGE